MWNFGFALVKLARIPQQRLKNSVKKDFLRYPLFFNPSKHSLMLERVGIKNGTSR